MILEYHRPESIEEALALLSRPDPLTVPLAGGSALNRPSREEFAVVDLQSLGLDTVRRRATFLELGAMFTLNRFLDGEGLPDLVDPGLGQTLKRVVEHEATHNLRQVASVAGTLVAADGRSPFATAFLALDAALMVQPGDEEVRLGDLLPFREQRLRGRLITRVTIPINVRLAYHYVARTPADRPIVCAAAALWPSGRLRVSLGGYGDSPRLAFDGAEFNGAEAAARSAYSQAGDEWASAEYRQDIAGVLTRRCLSELTGDGE